MANEILSKEFVITYNGAAIAKCKDFSLEINKETIEITTLDSAGWKEKLVNLKEWSVNFSGLVVRNGSFEALLIDLITDYTSKNIIIEDSNGSSSIQLGGAGFITKLTMGGSVGDVSGWDGVFMGTGALNAGNVYNNEFLYDKPFIIDDSYTVGQVVGKVNLFKDMADGSETFSITSDASADFQINSSTGVISLKTGASLTVGTHSVTVAGTLDGYPNDTCTISIEVYALGTEYYVDDVTGLDTDTGLTEALAKKTIAAGVALLSAGDKLWVKAATYSAEGTITLPNGATGSYVCIEGYKTTPGDINANSTEGYGDFEWGDIVSDTNVPLLDDGDRTGGNSGLFIDWNSANTNHIIKNLHITRYGYGVHLRDGSNSLIDNVVCTHIGNETTGVGNAINFVSSDIADHNIVRNSYVERAVQNGIVLQGDYNITDYCKVHDDNTGTMDACLDYYYRTTGSYNLVQNCYGERHGATAHSGHGITFYGVTTGEYNKGQHCEMVNIEKAFQFRWDKSAYNSFDDCIGTGASSKGVLFRDGAHHNTVNRFNAYDAYCGFEFLDSDEDAQNDPYSQFNTVNYSIVRDCTSVIYSRRVAGYTSVSENDVFNNCVFDGNDYLYNGSTAVKGEGSWAMNNCIFIGNIAIDDGDITHTVTYSNCDFYNNSFTTPTGTDLITSDPKFTDLINNDYTLQSDSPCINAGKDMSLTGGDFREMPLVGLPDIGILEYQG